MCGICCKCEWIGDVKIPYHNCCGTTSTSCLIINSYMAFCQSPNENRFRNCILCAIPCALASFGSIFSFIAEIICIPIGTCCGYTTGHPWVCYEKIGEVETKGYLSMEEIEKIVDEIKR
jgi:hypothetical protein